MAVTAQDLKTSIAAFMHRSASSFLVNGVDVLIRAMNNARLYSERKVDFELARVQAQVTTVDLLNGGDLTTATLVGTSTAVNVKKVKAAFLSFSDMGVFPIDLLSRDHWIFRMKKRLEFVKPTDTSKVVQITEEAFAMVQLGNIIYITPPDAKTLGVGPITVYMDVFQFLPDYGSHVSIGAASSTVAFKLVNATATFISDKVQIGSIATNKSTGASAVVQAVESQTSLLLNADIFLATQNYSVNVLNESDFLITNCFDWLMYRSIYELNFFLKEDERVTISEQIMSEAWQGLLSWNENMIQQAVDDVDLA